MRLRRAVKDQASLHKRTVSTNRSLLAYKKWKCMKAISIHVSSPNEYLGFREYHCDKNNGSNQAKAHIER